MTSARDLLFALTRQRFGDAHRTLAEGLCRRSHPDWKAIVRIAAEEGVAPIVGVNLAACDPAAMRVPAAVTERLQFGLFENAGLKARRRSELIGQIRDLDSLGFDVLLLKSVALEATGVYEHPWVTSAHDADILIRAREAGPERPEVAYRRALDASGVEHGDRTGHHDLSLNGVVTLSLDSFWRQARRVELDDVSACVLRPEDQLLTLCLNGCRKRFFRLKVLFDIAETLAYYRDFDWEYFASSVGATECQGVVFAALRAADATLGLPSDARARYASLLSRPHAWALGSMVRLLRRSQSRRHHVSLTALQYAAFNNRQRWRSAKYSVANRRGPAPGQIKSQLPGEQAA